jgi:hypothetical protein
MAAPKQEVVLCPVLLKIETKFEMYFGGFGRSPTQRKAQRLRHVTADAILQHGGSQTGSGLLYLKHLPALIYRNWSMSNI